MESRSQKSEVRSQNPDRQRDIITSRQWVELSRLLTERARSGFSANELATVNGFINYVAADVETIQQTTEG